MANKITKEDIEHQINDLVTNAILKDKDTDGAMGIGHLVKTALQDLAY